MEILQHKNTNNFNNLENYYPELVEKYPFLKSYIKNNNQPAGENRAEQKSVESAEINPFKKRCLLSLLLKTEIKSEQNYPAKENDEMQL